MKENGIRVKTDFSDNTIGKKIRLHRKMKPAYMIIIGDDEQNNKEVSLRTRDGNQKNNIPLNKFIASLTKECKTKDHKNLL